MRWRARSEARDSRRSRRPVGSPAHMIALAQSRFAPGHPRDGVGAMFRRLSTGTEVVDGIPVRWVAPRRPTTSAALWLTYLGGSAEASRPMLVRLARRGLVSCSLTRPGMEPGATGGPPRNWPARSWPPSGGGCGRCSAKRCWTAGGSWTGWRIDLASRRRTSPAGSRWAATPRSRWPVSSPGSRASVPSSRRSIGLAPGCAASNLTRRFSTRAGQTRAQQFFDALNPMQPSRRLRGDAVFISFQCGGADQQVSPDAVLALPRRAGEPRPGRRGPGARGRLRGAVARLGRERQAADSRRASSWLSRSRTILPG